MRKLFFRKGDFRSPTLPPTLPTGEHKPAEGLWSLVNKLWSSQPPQEPFSNTAGVAKFEFFKIFFWKLDKI